MRKKIILSISIFTFINVITSPLNLIGQTQDSVGKEEKIIIHKKGTCDEKLVIEIEGNTVKINGKDVDGYTSNDKKIIIKRKKDKNINHYNSPRQYHYFFKEPHDKKKNFFKKEDSNSGFLGIFLVDNEDITSITKGAIVKKVIPNSPAERAGIQEGDIVKKVNAKEIKNSSELINTIKEYKSGDTVKLVAYRNNKNIDMEVILSSRKNMTKNIEERDYKSKKYFMPIPRQEFEIEEEIEENFLKRKPSLGLKAKNTINNKGIEITSITKNSPASKAKLQKGDIIVKAYNEKIEDLEDFRDAMEDYYEPKKEELAIIIQRNQKKKKIIIPLPPILEEEEF